MLSDALLIIGALSLFVERLVDRGLTLVWPDNPDKKAAAGGPYTRVRPMLALVVGLILGLGIACGLNLNLVSVNFAGIRIEPWQGIILTGLMIGGGQGPTHEVIRWIEEKKRKAEKDAGADGAAAPPRTSRRRRAIG
jgi:hypothetical protein